MCSRDLPDMYALSALGLRAYISGKSLMPMLQLLHISLCMGIIKASAHGITKIYPCNYVLGVHGMTEIYYIIYIWSFGS